MVLLDKATKAFRAIPNIGITPDIRPEEAKHIRYLNIGFSLMVFINLAYFFQGLIDTKTPGIFLLAWPTVSILCFLVFIFNKLGQGIRNRTIWFILPRSRLRWIHI